MSQTPTLTLQLPTYASYGSWLSDDWRRLIDLAVVAEDEGVDRLVHVDHVVMGNNTQQYEWGNFDIPPDAPWLECLTVLAAVAAVTSRVRLSTRILIAPMRPAALLAKTAATIDQISGGRLDLGVGTGWQKEEFEAHDRGLPCALGGHPGEVRRSDRGLRGDLLHAQAGTDTAARLVRRRPARPEPTPDPGTR